MPNEYIEREAMIQRLQNTPLFSNFATCGIFLRKGVIDLIEKQTAADVVEVRHGYWIPSPDGINPIRCSECNMPAPFEAGENEFGDFEICRYLSSYCHECGAKMDGERKTEND